MDTDPSSARHLAAKWVGTKHERTDDDGVTEVVTVYTNLDPAGDENYLGLLQRWWSARQTRCQWRS